MKIELNPSYREIKRNLKVGENLCKLGEACSNTLICKPYAFSKRNFETFDISYTFLRLNITKFSTLRNSSAFRPIIRWITWIHQICRDAGISVTDALQLAEDRSFWRQIATAECYG